jgi:hypothetical protein
MLAVSNLLLSSYLVGCKHPCALVLEQACPAGCCSVLGIQYPCLSAVWSLTAGVCLCFLLFFVADWGLFLCPAPDVSLASRVAGHTLFVLGRELHRRVGFKDCVVPPDTRIGVGFGDRTALSEWMGQGFVQTLADGSKHVVVGTIVTELPCKELADSCGLG